MKSRYFLFAIFLLVIVGCEKNNTEETTDEYLVSYEIKLSLTNEQLLTQLSLGSFLYPEVSKLASTSIYGAEIYKIAYNTTFLGNPIVASGLISIPKSDGSFPVISFQNGTNTCHSNAPSSNSSDPVYSLISYLAGNGYIMSIPDYIGFGESSEFLHPYIHRQSSDIAVVDLLKALNELIEKKDISVSLNNDLFLMGYSQGGWATLSVLGELEENPVENFSVIAAACGAGSYNMFDMASYILEQTTYPNPFYMPYFVESRRQNGILSEPLTMFFNDPYAEIIPSLFDGSKCNSALNLELNDTISQVLTHDLIENFETGSQFANLKNELVNNSIPAWETTALIRFFHSKGDKSVPYSQTETAFNEFELLGVDAELLLIDSLDHNDAIITWGVDAVEWLNGLK